mmetsp:Transcript_8695/g.22150  ORF Transcript_8695/g.22150 Transcript_8695/m.22150 type:complete len:216 (-) Transcript_8695:581-1228(-)
MAAALGRRMACKMIRSCALASASTSADSGPSEPEPSCSEAKSPAEKASRAATRPEPEQLGSISTCVTRLNSSAHTSAAKKSAKRGVTISLPACSPTRRCSVARRAGSRSNAVIEPLPISEAQCSVLLPGEAHVSITSAPAGGASASALMQLDRSCNTRCPRATFSSSCKEVPGGSAKRPGSTGSAQKVPFCTASELAPAAAGTQRRPREVRCARA